MVPHHWRRDTWTKRGSWDERDTEVYLARCYTEMGWIGCINIRTAACLEWKHAEIGLGTAWLLIDVMMLDVIEVGSDGG